MAEEKNKHLLQMQTKLNSVSPSLCLAKWKQVTIHLHNGETHSCHHPATHHIGLEEIAESPTALHNTRFKKMQRKLMKEGKFPSECEYCWAVEKSATQVSDRIIKSSDSWAEPFFNEVAEREWHEDVNPSYVEVSFSSACNFKCSYCSPYVSSKWMEEIRAHGPYPVSIENNGLIAEDARRIPRKPNEENPYVDAFEKWWPELAPTLKVFRITGGEPLLSPNTFKILEDIAVNPRPNLELSINTNLGATEALIERMIALLGKIVRDQHAKRVVIYTSVDTWGEQAEYIRHGLQFDYFWKNVRRVLTEVPGADLIFMSTFNALSVPSYKTLLKNILDLKKEFSRSSDRRTAVTLDIPYLSHPIRQTVRILTEDWLRKIDELREFMRASSGDHDNRLFNATEIQKMERLLPWARTPMSEPELMRSRAEFFAFFREHDRRRGTDFLATFPEMTAFWELCEKQLSQYEVLRPKMPETR